LSEAVDAFVARLGPLAGPGERVAVISPNAPALVIALFAAWRTGAVVVPLTARLRDYELRRVLADAEPAAIVSVSAHQGYSFRDLLTELVPGLPGLRGCLIVDEAGELEAEMVGGSEEGNPIGEERSPSVGRASTGPLHPPPDVAAILYTSGTTGAPKGTLVKRGCGLAGAEGLAERLVLDPDDAAVLVVPASHAFGLGCLLAGVRAGAATVLVEASGSLAPLTGALGQGATLLHGPPALFGRLLAAAPEGVPGLRGGLVAGAPCPATVLERLDALETRVLNVYGLTETGAATACAAEDAPDLRHTTVGRPLAGYEFRVAGGDADEPGELQVRGPHVTPGYLGRPDETAAAFDGEWLRTGDLGTIDDAGYVRIAGRAKEVVNVGGFNVFPAEVEGFLQTHPDVVQVAVVGMPHERMGESLAAFVVARPDSGLTPGDLLRFARPQIAGYKLPYAIQLVSELPLVASGKPDRAALARLAGERATTPSASAPAGASTR